MCEISGTEASVRHYLDLFFRGRHDCHGRPLAAGAAHDPRFCRLVAEAEFLGGIDAIYARLGGDCTPAEMARLGQAGQLADDTIRVLALLRECAARGVPKQYAPGVILVYLELCQGLAAAAA